MLTREQEVWLWQAVAQTLAKESAHGIATLKILSLIGPSFQADRAWLVRFNQSISLWWVASEWCASEVEACLPDLSGIPIQLLARPLVDLLQGQPVVYADIEKIADDQDLKEEMRRQGNRATCGVPVFRDGRLTGLVGLDDVHAIHAWSADEMALLQRFAEVVVDADDRAQGGEPMIPPHRSASADGESEGVYLRAGNCHLAALWQDILAVEAEGDYTQVRLRSGQLLLDRRSMSEWNVILPTSQFMRVHRSWYVNWRHVRRLLKSGGGKWTLHLRGFEQEIPVSRSHQSAVHDLIRRFPV